MPRSSYTGSVMHFILSVCLNLLLADVCVRVSPGSWKYLNLKAANSRPRKSLKILECDLLVLENFDWTHTHIRLTALCLGLPRWAGTTKVKPIWILLKQETVSGSGISWAICKFAPRSRQITMPVPHHSVFLQAGCPSSAQPIVSKHWRQKNFDWTLEGYSFELFAVLLWIAVTW